MIYREVVMFKYNDTKGFLVAIDGPNGVGKTTLIKKPKTKLEIEKNEVYITKEPTDTDLGKFTRNFAEHHAGISLACLVAADRYEHISAEILPELSKGKIVITDRYILSSLILQCMDNVKDTVIFSLNSEIVKPNLQIAVFANEDILQNRLLERKILTRFEKENQSHNELYYMEKGVKALQKEGIDVLMINNNNNLEENVQKIISHIVAKWRTK